MFESNSTDTISQFHLDYLMGRFADSVDAYWNRYLREIIAFVDNFTNGRPQPDESFMLEIERDIVDFDKVFNFRLQILADVARYATTGQIRRVSHTMQPLLRVGIERYVLSHFDQNFKLPRPAVSGSVMTWDMAKSYLERTYEEFDVNVLNQLLQLLSSQLSSSSTVEA